jgi:predicted ATPase/class 3 adenylate cyclase
MNCPKCGAPNSPAANFCAQCGRSLRPNERPHSFVQWLQNGAKGEGERRQVTILACDTVGSSLLAERMDPEEFLELINRAFDALLYPVFDYGGYLARLEGDGFKAFFGAPEAHEDDPLRAVQAGLEIQAAARHVAAEFEKKRNVPNFAVRVGIHTDHVVVGPVGIGDAVEYTAMGIGIVLAARLESIAQPGTVLISEATHRLVESYVEAVPLGPTKVKGRTQPVRVFEVTGMRTAAELSETLGVRSPLVGRNVERSMLRQAVAKLFGYLDPATLPLNCADKAPETSTHTLPTDGKTNRRAESLAGRGGIAIIVGEAGVGKSRLINHAHHELTQTYCQLTWLKGRALSQGQGAYGVLANLVRRYLGINADDRMADMWAKLRHRIDQLFAAPALGAEDPTIEGELIPHLANLLSLHMEGKQARRVTDLDPGGQERQIFRALRRLCQRLTQDGPLVLALDDLQWADDGAIRLLKDLMSLTDEWPMLMIFSFRPEAQAACWQLREAARRDHGQDSVEIMLHGLSSAASDELIENLIQTATDGDPPEQLCALIRERSGGNPMFIEEVVRSLLDQGALQRSDQPWPATQMPANDIPETLHGVISARLDRLDPESRHTLQIAAVIGRTFSFRLLQAVTQNHSNLAQHLSRLQRAELVRELRQGAEQEYNFTHTLTRQVAYETLLRRQRRKYHRRVAKCIRDLYADRLEEHFERLAYHYASAEMWPQALTYHIKFAQQAQLRYANGKATEHYQRAWEIIQAGQIDQPETQQLLHESQADLDLLAGNYPQASFGYQAALELAQERPHQARLLRKLGHVCQRWGKYKEGIEYLERGLETAAAIGYGPELAALYAGLGQVYHRQGNYRQAADLGLLALEIFEQLDDQPGTALASNLLGITHWAMSELDKAQDYHEKSLLTHASLGDVYGLSASYNNLGRVLADIGQLERAMNNYYQSQRLCTEIGHQHGLATVLNNISELYQQLGHTDKAWSYQKQAFEIYKRIGFDGLDLQPEILKMQVW